MSAYMLLCNFTDQGVRTIKDSAKRRAAAQELGKKLALISKPAISLEQPMTSPPCGER